MADRGFNIQDMLARKGVNVKIPPFMNETGEFEERELFETRRTNLNTVRHTNCCFHGR